MAADSKLVDRPEWVALQRHYEQIKDAHLRDLFAGEPDRAAALTLEECGILLDYSKNRITAETLATLVALAEAVGLRDAIERMFTGEKINTTENRAVLHVALRNRSDEPIYVDGKDVMGGDTCGAGADGGVCGEGPFGGVDGVYGQADRECGEHRHRRFGLGAGDGV